MIKNMFDVINKSFVFIEICVPSTFKLKEIAFVIHNSRVPLIKMKIGLDDDLIRKKVINCLRSKQYLQIDSVFLQKKS